MQQGTGATKGKHKEATGSLTQQASSVMWFTSATDNNFIPIYQVPGTHSSSLSPVQTPPRRIILFFTPLAAETRATSRNRRADVGRHVCYQGFPSECDGLEITGGREIRDGVSTHVGVMGVMEVMGAVVMSASCLAD